jgi:hypothetical protein
MKKLEFVLCGLLALGGVGHLIGTITGYEPGTEVFVWSLAGSTLTFLIVYLHVLRVRRGDDRPLAIAAAVSTAAWIGLALGFGAAVGDVADPRALMHVVVSLALLVTTGIGLYSTSTLLTRSSGGPHLGSTP